MAKKEVKPEPEPMEVSIHEESDQEIFKNLNGIIYAYYQKIQLLL